MFKLYTKDSGDLNTQKNKLNVKRMNMFKYVAE